MIRKSAINLDKRQIRKETLALRDTLSKECRHEKSAAIFEKIYSLETFRKASIVLAFASFGSEVETDAFLVHTAALGKKVYCPLITPEKKMVFHLFTSMQDLHAGYKGILEPLSETEAFHTDDHTPEEVFVLMPGVAFDRQKHRIGYGKGFYDTFFADYPAFKAAVCFECQMVSEIPTCTHDVSPDIIVTEHSIYN